VKLSNKLEYACRVLAQLGRREGGDRLAHIDALAAAEAIPANYLVQILNELRNAGLIVSRRGKQGGYALERSPDQITLMEVVRAVDPDLLDLKLKSEGESGARVGAVWKAIADELNALMERYTLEAFLQEERGEMYYI